MGAGFFETHLVQEWLACSWLGFMAVLVVVS